ncbi:MAG: twin-arginine translocation signal domain-containing protein [Nitrososphaeraceae archaeon]
MNKDINKNDRITKIYNHTNNSNSNKSANYTRRDFLKLLGSGIAFLTLGGLLNHNFRSFSNIPFHASATNNNNNTSYQLMIYL